MWLGFLLFLGYVVLYVLSIHVDGNIYLRPVLADVRIMYMICATFPLYDLVIQPIYKKTQWYLSRKRDPEENEVTHTFRTGLKRDAR